jgi:hypothetical protein
MNVRPIRNDTDYRAASYVIGLAAQVGFALMPLVRSPHS